MNDREEGTIRETRKGKGLPCEYSVWYILPSVRRKVAQILIQEHHLSQRRTAAILGITEAAVSQYVHGRRGALSLTSDEEEMARAKVKMIVEKGEEVDITEVICPICRTIARRMGLEVDGHPRRKVANTGP